MKNSKILALALVSIFTFSSCNEDDPIAVNEEELITTVTTILTATGKPTVTMTSKDLDGDGPLAPAVTVSSNLSINTTYIGAVTFLNESVTPVDNITLEVKEEGYEHQLFFQAPPAIGVFAYTDLDKNGKPIGLEFTLRTGSAAATGDIVVVLRHKPLKDAAGVVAGSITNAAGSTDASVTYRVELR
jgi:hypothetical protein